jgi:hypothetical protein
MAPGWKITETLYNSLKAERGKLTAGGSRYYREVSGV